MQKLKTIIVEDELYDRKIIEKILVDHYSNNIDIVDSVNNTDTAIASIKRNNPDLVFMDIELNGDRNGAFHILEKVDQTFKIIFVTAKSEQDDFLKAIRLSCIDYLVKPTKISDFEVPIQRALHDIQNSIENLSTSIDIFRHNIENKEKQESKISLQEGYTYIPTPVKEIVRCEAQGNYTKFYFKNQSGKLINGNLKFYDERLHEFGFCRINKSELINLFQIQSFSKRNTAWEVTMSDKKTLYISNQRKNSFLTQYNEMHL